MTSDYHKFWVIIPHVYPMVILQAEFLTSNFKFRLKDLWIIILFGLIYVALNYVMTIHIMKRQLYWFLNYEDLNTLWAILIIYVVLIVAFLTLVKITNREKTKLK